MKSRRLLAGLAACAALALLGAAPGPKRKTARSSAPAETVVVISSLASARQYADRVEKQRPALTRFDGRLEGGDAVSQVAAFTRGGKLVLIEEDALFGDQGAQGSARIRYALQQGRLVFYESFGVRPRDVGRGRRPARDEWTIALAYDDSGRLIGSEKIVNREKQELGPDDERAALARFQALAAKVAEAGG